MTSKMVDQFLEMVRIDSESGNEHNMIQYLKNEFDSMGGLTHIDPYGNLMARFQAIDCLQDEPILFSCHADTVKPGVGIRPYIKDGIIRSEGKTILGADDKAGIAELLEALRGRTSRPTIEIAITREEEVGLLGVKNLDFKWLRSKKGYLLDNDTLETIIIGGPSYFTLDVDIKGKSAHAGMEPEKGVSAVMAASRAIAALPHGRIDHETTSNVGIIHGGLIRNGVPEETSFLAECRSLDHVKAEKLAGEMHDIIQIEVKKMGAAVHIHMENPFKAVSIPEDSETVIVSKQALEKAGIKARTDYMTGFTDASIYNNMGIEMAVVGIGARLEHSPDEHIYVSDMEKAVIMIQEIMSISSRKK